jgi:hypothetical protein
MEIDGIAHIILRLARFEECVEFYDALMPRLGQAAGRNGRRRRRLRRPPDRV